MWTWDAKWGDGSGRVYGFGRCHSPWNEEEFLPLWGSPAQQWAKGSERLLAGRTVCVGSSFSVAGKFLKLLNIIARGEGPDEWWVDLRTALGEALD